jgi:PKD repeat protein
MFRKIIAGLISLCVLAGLVAVWGGVVGEANAAIAQQGYAPPPSPRQGRQGDPNAPDISFIDSPTAQCYMPEAHKDTCYIQWDYLQVSASTSQYIVSMTVAIDGRMGAYHSGFFQTSMYVPVDFFRPGLRVTCGPPGSNPNPFLGTTHTYTIRARETGGLSAANYGSVTCPADVVPPDSLALSGQNAGRVGVTYPFTATVLPITTTVPLSYIWQVSNYPTITITQGLSATQSFSWSTPGIKQILVNAFNAAGAISSTHSILIDAPIIGLSASNDGPSRPGQTTQLTATITSGTNPIFTWDLGDGANASSASIGHIYPSSGDYTATVTASNGAGEQVATTRVTILREIFLPVLRRNP